MILGMSVATFTLVHVVLSLIGIAAGIVAVLALAGSRLLPGWTLVFLITTILTSVTGYFFPVDKVLPSHIVGAISLVALAIAVIALYRARLAGHWRWLYVASATLALYLNVFVLVVQAFLRIGALKTLAPTQSEPPFLVAQGAVLLLAGIVGFMALRRFHPARAPTAAIRVT